jgi:hypothetical protein
MEIEMVGQRDDIWELLKVDLKVCRLVALLDV